MSRRRKKNQLLMRILVGSIVAHVIALPILAHFGAFEKIQKQFGQARVVLVNNAVAKEAKQPEKTEKKADKPEAKSKGSGGSAKKASGASKSNVNEVKVVASAGNGAGGGADTPTVDANASGKAGAIPTQKQAIGSGGGETPTIPATPKAEAPVRPTTSVEKTTPKEEVAVKKPVEPKREPKYVEMEAITSPQPVIPDDLRSDPLEKTLVVETVVSEDGIPTKVEIVQSTGIKELDTLGLETARKWKFRPATLDGKAVQGKVRFRIEFKVE